MREVDVTDARGSRALLRGARWRRRSLVRLLDDPPAGDRDRLDHEESEVADDRVGDPRVADVVALDVEAEAFAHEPAAVGEPDVEVELNPVLHGSMVGRRTSRAPYTLA